MGPNIFHRACDLVCCADTPGEEHRSHRLEHGPNSGGFSSGSCRFCAPWVVSHHCQPRRAWRPAIRVWQLPLSACGGERHFPASTLGGLSVVQLALALSASFSLCILSSISRCILSPISLRSLSAFSFDLSAFSFGMSVSLSLASGALCCSVTSAQSKSSVQSHPELQCSHQETPLAQMHVVHFIQSLS